MNDAFTVSGVECIGNFDAKSDNTLGIEGACGDQVFQRYAVQVLHGDERMAFVSPNFVDGADIRVIKRRCTACFAAKTFQCIRILAAFSGRNLRATNRPSSWSWAL